MHYVARPLFGSNCWCCAVAGVVLAVDVAETLCYLLVGPSDQSGASQNIEVNLYFLSEGKGPGNFIIVRNLAGIALMH